MADLVTQRGPYDRLPFPAEIRNKIYLYTLNATSHSLILWASDRQWTQPQRTADLSLLRVSRATSEEAASLLCAEKSFSIVVDIDKLERLSSIIPKVNLMNDVALDLSNFSLDRKHTGEATPSIFESIVSMCTGTDAVREYIEIAFDAVYLTEWMEAHQCTSERGFEALGKLKCFQRVNIKLCWKNVPALGENDEKYLDTLETIKTILRPSLEFGWDDGDPQYCRKALRGIYDDEQDPDDDPGIWLFFYSRLYLASRRKQVR